MDEGLARLIDLLYRLDPDLDAQAVCEILLLAAVRTGPESAAELGLPPAPRNKHLGQLARQFDPFSRRPQGGHGEASREAGQQDTDTDADASPQSPVSVYEPIVNGLLGSVARRNTASAVLPVAASTPRLLELGRALRPFKRVRAPGHRHELDIEGTAENYARCGVLIPSMRRIPERWPELILVVDRSMSMAAWDRVSAELAVLFRRLGAFKRVLVWDLIADGGGQLQLRGPRGKPVTPMRPLIAEAGSRLVMFSDCAADFWFESPIWNLLRAWGGALPTSVVSPLPPRLWRQTALNLSATRVTRPRLPLDRNTGLKYRTPWHLEVQPERYRSLLPVPVATLTPHSLGGWAGALMSGDPDGCDAVLVPEGGRSAYQTMNNDEPLTGEKLVAAFLTNASEAAAALAVLCAPFTALTMPVLRLIQQRMVPEATMVDLAETVIGGLFVTSGAVTTPTGSNPVFELRPDVRPVLQDLLGTDETWRMQDALNSYVATRAGLPGTLPIAVDDPDGELLLAGELRPFAIAQRDTLRLLGVAPVSVPDRDSVEGGGSPELTTVTEATPRRHEEGESVARVDESPELSDLQERPARPQVRREPETEELGGSSIDLTESMLASAGMLANTAPMACTQGNERWEPCEWYHGSWQYLRLLDMVSGPQRHDEFYRIELRRAVERLYRRKAAQSPKGGPDAVPRVLISGAADYSMLAYVVRALREAEIPRAEEPTPVHVLDICPTPLMACSWYSRRIDHPVKTHELDICGDWSVAEQFSERFDLIVTDAFLNQLSTEDCMKALDRWRELLNLGGSLITTVPFYGLDAPQTIRMQEIDDFVARTHATEHGWLVRLQAGGASISNSARVFARRIKNTNFGDARTVTELFQQAGFDVTPDSEQIHHVADDLGEPSYLRVVARKPAGVSEGVGSGAPRRAGSRTRDETTPKASLIEPGLLTQFVDEVHRQRERRLLEANFPAAQLSSQSRVFSLDVDGDAGVLVSLQPRQRRKQLRVHVPAQLIEEAKAWADREDTISAPWWALDLLGGQLSAERPPRTPEEFERAKLDRLVGQAVPDFRHIYKEPRRIATEREHQYRDQIEQVLIRSHGSVLIDGRTGSGKSTLTALWAYRCVRSGAARIDLDMIDPSDGAQSVMSALLTIPPRDWYVVVMENISYNFGRAAEVYELARRLKGEYGYDIAVLANGWLDLNVSEAGATVAARLRLPRGTLHVPTEPIKAFDAMVEGRGLDPGQIEALRERCGGGEDLVLAKLALGYVDMHGHVPTRAEFTEHVAEHFKLTELRDPEERAALYRFACLGLNEIELPAAEIMYIYSRFIDRFTDQGLIEQAGNTYRIGSRSVAREVARYAYRNWTDADGKQMLAPAVVQADALRHAGTAQIQAVLDRLDFINTSRAGAPATGRMLASMWTHRERIKRLMETAVRQDPEWGDNVASATFACMALRQLDLVDQWEQCADWIRRRWHYQTPGELPIWRSENSAESAHFKRMVESMSREDAALGADRSWPEELRGNRVDPDRMHRTWMLGMLLCLEGTAPRRDHDRLESLYESASMAQGPNGAFYPNRVPWVTARVLTGLCLAGYADTMVARNAAKWLLRDSFNFGWKSGTGTWNSDVMTTAMSVTALLRQGTPADTHQIMLGLNMISDLPVVRPSEIDTAYVVEAMLLGSPERDTRTTAYNLLDELLVWASNEQQWTENSRPSPISRLESPRGEGASGGLPFVVSQVLTCIWYVVVNELATVFAEDFDRGDEIEDTGKATAQSVPHEPRATQTPVSAADQSARITALVDYRLSQISRQLTDDIESRERAMRALRQKRQRAILQAQLTTFTELQRTYDDCVREYQTGHLTSELTERINRLGAEVMGDSYEPIPT